jgi:protein tyrosine/serine phosphatase
MSLSRILPFEGVDNFRDYGDYATRHGARLTRGILYRSAHHARATEADQQRMADLGLSTVVDLRRKSERDREPSRRPASFSARVIDNDIGDVGLAPHMTFVATEELTPASVRAFMIEEYRRIPFEPRHLDLYRRYFQALASGDGALVIHCAAGKDRTGLLAALTHKVVGVHDDDIYEDYLLTNTAARIEERAPMSQETIRQATGRTPTLEAVRAFLGVLPDYLEAAFVEIDSGHGALDAYLERALGVDADVKARLRARLLA